jgi:hypothetical protein
MRVPGILQGRLFKADVTEHRPLEVLFALIVFVWVVRRWLQIVVARAGAGGVFFNGLLDQRSGSPYFLSADHSCRTAAKDGTRGLTPCRYFQQGPRTPLFRGKVTLVHGEETDVFSDAGYQGVSKREETQGINVNWHVAMRPGKRKALDKSTTMGAILDQLEQAKARIRAMVEHPFRVIKRQFGHVKVRYRGLVKNTAQLHTLFALSNLWMVRRTLLQEWRG